MVTGFHIGITENHQDAASNISNVTVALTITWNGGSYNATGNATGVLTIDGESYDFNAKFNTDQKTSGSEVIYRQTLDIAHGDDGSKSLSCDASFITGTMVGTVTASATKTLTPIPRESTIGATDANIGATALISVNRKNAEYTHCIAYRFGELSGYLADGDGKTSAQAVKLTSVSLSFPIPKDFYGQIPHSKTGICTLTVKTYSGETQIGSEKTCTFMVTAGEEICRPEVSGTVVDINEATLALTGSENKLVLGMSTACCTIMAQAKNGASLSRKTVNGVEVGGTEQILPNVEKDQFLFSATDSRGYTGYFALPVEAVDYVALTCNAQAVRTNPTSGKGVLTVSGNYFAGDFGMQENSLRLYYQINEGEPVEIIPEIKGNQYTATANLSGMNYQQAHTVTVTAEDALMKVSKTLTVGKGMPVFDWGENDFSFNVPVSVQGVPLGTVLSTLRDLDNFVFSDLKFHLGYGLVNGEGCICFNIGPVALQLKVRSGNQVLIRCKYINSAWGQWLLLS